jgi:hypothetical protein
MVERLNVHITCDAPSALLAIKVVQLNPRCWFVLIYELPLHAPQLAKPEAVALIRHLRASISPCTVCHGPLEQEFRKQTREKFIFFNLCCAGKLQLGGVPGIRVLALTFEDRRMLLGPACTCVY